MRFFHYVAYNANGSVKSQMFSKAARSTRKYPSGMFAGDSFSNVVLFSAINKGASKITVNWTGRIDEPLKVNPMLFT